MSLPGFTLDTDWVVRDGFTVLFGYSGSGKSLTLAAIAGTLRPDAGCIRLAGRTLFDSSTGVWVPPQQRKISYVPQSAHLFPHMTLRRNVAFALKGVGRVERECRVEDVLERLHITRLAEKFPHQLSGGQRQRGALARALVGEPAALLLDEPLSALDLPTRVEMREVLRDVQLDTEIPIIMVQVGSPRELVANPSTPEIRRLLNAIEVPASTFRDTRRRAGVVVPLIRGEQRAARRAL
jgi:molybdate transport system ATP-binding protein